MRYYGRKGYRNPNFIIQGRDTNQEDRSIGCQFIDIAEDLAKHFKSFGFWRVKYKEKVR